MTSKSEVTSSKTFTKLERRYDLDWLRIVSILLVFFYHSTLFFSTPSWLMKNAETSRYLSGIMNFGTAFALPLFFVIAGMSTFYALNFVSAGKYTAMRALRLLLPFILGIFTHIPLQIYLASSLSGSISTSFTQFYDGLMFNGIYELGTGYFAIFGTHLWFLVILFVCSLILIVPFVLLRKEKAQKGLQKTTSFLRKPGVIFTLVIPVILFEYLNLAIGDVIPRVGGYPMYSYILFYFFGYIIATDAKFKEAIEKQIIPALIITIASAAVLAPLLFLNYDLYETAGYHPLKNVYFLLYPIFGWSLVILFLGLGSKYFNKNNRVRKFLNELVLPFYILHQTVLLVVGYFVIPLAFSAFVKFVIIFFTSLAIIVILLMIIKYINPIRVLFGMRWKKDLIRGTKVKEEIPTTIIEN
ncbi:MAG: acyltransferase family protein [Asgard group archaeon]|nr:acyltransferase family protein [Asgard group archaeon]